MGKLDNKVAVVTGASKGIGAGIAKALAAEGAAVVVNFSTDEAGADRTLKAITAAGGTAIAVGASVLKENEVAKLFSTTKDRFGKLDILVNNAGVVSFAPIESMTVEEYQRIFDTNVRGLLLATRAASSLFPATGGSIVNISSAVSSIAPPGLSVYAASKGAIDVITKSLAKELAPRKIRVNAINAGIIVTEGTKTAGIIGSDAEKMFVSMTPLGRAGQPEDVARPTVFLVSEDAAYITGETLFVSGGAGL